MKNIIGTALLSSALFLTGCNTEGQSHKTENELKQIQMKEDFYNGKILQCIDGNNTYNYKDINGIEIIPRKNCKKEEGCSIYNVIDPNYTERKDFKIIPILNCKITEDITKILEK